MAYAATVCAYGSLLRQSPPVCYSMCLRYSRMQDGNRHSMLRDVRYCHSVCNFTLATRCPVRSAMLLRGVRYCRSVCSYAINLRGQRY
eukprot:3745397-Rhodomonas_salina.3